MIHLREYDASWSQADGHPDGGGVRGLSSLLILRLLLVLVTEQLIKTGVISRDHAPVEPQDVFDVATGTSTGG